MVGEGAKATSSELEQVTSERKGLKDNGMESPIKYVRAWADGGCSGDEETEREVEGKCVRRWKGSC